MRPRTDGGETSYQSHGRPGQPAELTPVHVLLASDEAGHVSGARVAVTGDHPIL
jgi:hypothetical protein